MTGCVLVAHPGAELYGSDRVMVETVDALVRDGRRVTVALPGPGPLHDRVRAVGGEPVICPSPVLRKEALRPKGFVRLVADTVTAVRPGLELIRGTGAEVVYVSTVTVPLWFVLAALLRRPTICHLHEAETGVPKVVQTLLALPLLLCRRIVSNSDFSRSVLTSAVGRLDARCVVVPNPVPGPPTRTPSREVLTDPVRLLYVGRLSPRKGPQVAVDAVSKLVGEGRDLAFDLLGSVFTGYEWFEAELRDRVARDGLADRVRFLGFRPDVWPELARVDVVVAPSLADEPFGNTAVEAILAARPVVVSGAGGLIEAVDGYAAAHRVPPGDADALAAAIAAVITDWSRTRVAAEADAAVAADRHSPDRYRSRMVAIFDAVVGDPVVEREPG